MPDVEAVFSLVVTDGCREERLALPLSYMHRITHPVKQLSSALLLQPRTQKFFLDSHLSRLVQQRIQIQLSSTSTNSNSLCYNNLTERRKAVPNQVSTSTALV
ncbi:hypothetical protein NPIL_208111 [Nephila pilipes]|uniref:Uncharacterized protein n=1 Tax=Nephila pilipes TaxID=299642 RepID=A0A8X6NWR6_NEPPI|nr:hypothetical protein NPIL_208111 [Nephila pilipes]